MLKDDFLFCLDCYNYFYVKKCVVCIKFIIGKCFILVWFYYDIVIIMENVIQ